MFFRKLNKAEIQIMNGKILQKTQNKTKRRKGSPLRHKQHYINVYFPFKLHLLMYDNMHTNYTHVCTNDNVSRTLVYS